MSEWRRGVLHHEHELLGASFEASESTGLLGVASYATEPADPLASTSGALLADLTGSAYQLVSGADAEALVSGACAGRPLNVGEASFGVVLAGDGGVLSVPLALRTGDEEFVLVDATERGEALVGWLSFLHGLEGSPFSSADVRDASDLLVPLVVAGPASDGVLGDYLSEGASLPAEGEVAQVRLDAIGALVAGVPLPGLAPAYLVLIPPAAAHIIWRSLLSFTEVEPVGSRGLRRALSSALPWAPALEGDGAARVSRDELARWGLVRPQNDYVGARGLSS